ncbi:MAG TPA: hypothetical protein VGF61_14480, partial [Candidatus Acidoferrum sp.]
NRGCVLEAMLRFAPDGLFFAFEPLPELFEYLRSRFGSDPRVRLYNLAAAGSSWRVAHTILPVTVVSMKTGDGILFV